MNKYYLHDGFESTGPFDLDEIKTKQISKTTSVWCEGMEDWKKAGEVEELKKLLFSGPPPFNPIFIKTPIDNTVDDTDYPKKDWEQEEQREPTKILGLRKRHFSIIIGLLVLVILIFMANTYQDNRRSELDQKNDQTDAQNLQYNQKETEAQDNKIAEMERLAQEKLALEQKQARDKRLLEIKNLLTVDYANLENAQKRLDNASTFQLFRTPEEKNIELSAIQKDLDRWQTEIDNLEKETTRLNQN